MNCSTETSQPNSPRRASAGRGAASRAARARGGWRARPGRPRQPGAPLERLRRAHRPRPGDRVDRAVVEPVCAQGDLETRDLRVPGVRGRGQRERCQQGRADCDESAGHERTRFVPRT